jgi:hypothetical protein
MGQDASPDANLRDIFDVILAGLMSVDASRRQLQGIMAWQFYVHDALQARQEAGVRGQVLVTGDDCTTHPGWRNTTREIIRVLARHAAEAERLYFSHIQAATQLEADAAECLVTGSLAAAAACAALAAEQHYHAGLASNWQSSAAEAAGHGRLLVATEDATDAPVAAAISVVGGLHQVATDKWYHQGLIRGAA